MVRILAVSDEELIEGRDAVIDDYVKEEIDLLINCGDISPSYMEYLIYSYKPKNTIMVHGNHDKVFYSSRESEIEESDGFSTVYQGSYVLTDGVKKIENPSPSEDFLNICGFSGAFAYGDWPFYYDEKKANSFVRGLGFKDFFNRLEQLDIMMTHSAPQINNKLPVVDHHHRPSDEIGKIHKEFKPRIWFYGHIHPRYTNDQLDYVFEDETGVTHLINTVPFKVVDYNQKTQEISIVNSYDG